MKSEAVSVSEDTIQLFTKIFDSKQHLDGISERINNEQLRQMAGRFTRGSKEEDFEYLQKDGSTVKKFAWIVDGHGLSSFLEHSNLDALRLLGCEDKWIRKKLEDNEYFRLGIFYKPKECFPATWEGIFSLIETYYHGSIWMRIRKHTDELKRIDFDEIERRARLSYLRGASYFEINESAIDGNSTDPRFMSEERFLQCEGTLEEARGFLYNRLGLSALFDGNGLTKDSKGKLCLREYLIPNIPVRNLPGFRYLNLTIDIAELTPNAEPKTYEMIH